jgi:hypothetical protein
MWLDLLLILLAVSPLMPLGHFRWSNPGSKTDTKQEAQLTGCSVPR